MVSDIDPNILDMWRRRIFAGLGISHLLLGEHPAYIYIEGDDREEPYEFPEEFEW